MRFYYDIRRKGFVESLGTLSLIARDSVEMRVKRGDGEPVELQLFYLDENTGPVVERLEEVFDMRFAALAVSAWRTEAIAIEENHGFNSDYSVYVGRPSWNTLQLTARFISAEGVDSYTDSHELTTANKSRLVAIAKSTDTSLTVPAALGSDNDAYYILNNGTGNVTIATKSGAGVGFTVPAGLSVILAPGKYVKLTRTASLAYSVSRPAELDEVTLMGEWTWRSASEALPTSTPKIKVVVENDVIVGNEAAPTDAAAPTIYVTKTELAGLISADVTQGYDDTQKARARGNIGALGAGDVVTVTEQDLDAGQQAQVLENIGAASASDLANLTTVVGTKAASSTVTALTSTVSGKASQGSVDALDVRLDVIEAALGSAMKRQPLLYQAVGGSATVHLLGVAAGDTGTASTRNVALVDAGSTMTNGVATDTFIHATGYTLANNNKVQVTNTAGTQPSPLLLGEWYYVTNYDAGTRSFKLAATLGGSAIARSSAGSGTTKIAKAAPSSYFLQSPRKAFVSAATAGSSCGTRHTLPQVALSSLASVGGWTFAARFGVGDAAAVANARLFIGLRGLGAVIGNVNPSSLTNIIGLGADSGESNLHILHNDSSGTASKYDLGSDFPANTRQTDLYDFTLKAASDGLSVDWEVKRLGTAFTASGTVSTNLPKDGVLLAPHLWRNNGSTALAVILEVSAWILQ